MRGMLLTAGLGTRLRPITDSLAKPAVPFLGIPLLKYPLYLMKLAGIRDLVLNSHYKPEQITALAHQVSNIDLRVQVSHEESAPLGSGGGVWKARSLLGSDDFLVCNGDEVILPHDPSLISKFKADHLKHSSLATIMVMNHALVGTQFGGVWADELGNVRGFGKDAKEFGEDSAGYHYIGVLLLSPRIFDYMPEGESNIFYDVLKSAIAAGETVRAFSSEFTWFETGNPQDFLSATGEAMKLLNEGTGEDAKVLRAITSCYWPSGMKLERKEKALILKSPSAELSPDASLNGFVVLEENSRIGRKAALENVVLMPKAVVETAKKNQIVL